MKKFILLVLILLISAVCYAEMNPYITGIYTASGEDYSDILFHYNCENTSDSTKPSGGSAITGSQSDPAMTWTTTVTIPVGSYVCERNAAWKALTYTITTDHFDRAQGAIGFWVKNIATPVTATEFVEYEGLTDDAIYVRFSGDQGALKIKMGDGTLLSEHVTTFELTQDIWYYIVVAWDSGVSFKYTIYNSSCVSQETVTDTTDIPTLDETIKSFVVGHASATAGQIYIDNVVISNDDTRELCAIRNNSSYE